MKYRLKLTQQEVDVFKVEGVIHIREKDELPAWIISLIKAGRLEILKDTIVIDGQNAQPHEWLVHFNENVEVFSEERLDTTFEKFRDDI